MPAAGQVDIAAAMSITFVTGNKKKLEEVKAILSGVLDNITNVSVSLFALCGPEPYSSALSHSPRLPRRGQLDLPELQGTPEYVAIEKCKLASREIKGPVLTEVIMRAAVRIRIATIAAF